MWSQCEAIHIHKMVCENRQTRGICSISNGRIVIRVVHVVLVLLLVLEVLGVE